jgi:glucose-6-phosphate isomerase
MAQGGGRRDVRLELGTVLAPPLEPAHGLARAEIAGVLPRMARVIPELLAPGAPSGFLGVLRRPRVFREVERAAARWRRRGVDDVVHVGIGGSALGAEVLMRALAHPFHNLLARRARGGPRVHFVDNVDPETLGALLEVVDPSRALVHVVSKSGSTVETAAGFQVLREALARRTRRWASRCVFTTGKGALRALAEQEGVETLGFPEDVGGRFSVLTASGLFTPAVAGVDVAAVLAGARRMLGRLGRAPLEENPAALAAAVCFLAAETRGKPIHVLMPYADALEPLARWYVQLAGESLGKRALRGGEARGVGPTPLPARGTTDQHSQVQLFVEGPPDKLVIFVAAVAERRSVEIPGGEPAPYLAGVSLGSLLRAEQAGTAVALARAGRPSLCWQLPRIDGDALGQLFVALEAQTVLQAELLGVNAYDQPGVEAGKIAAFSLIGRRGFERERAALEADRPPSWRV